MKRADLLTSDSPRYGSRPTTQAASRRNDDRPDSGTDARSVAYAWLALGVPGTTGRLFVTCSLSFAAILWGEVGRGAFFRTDLLVFLGLAVGAAATVPDVWRLMFRTPWLLWSSTGISIAIVVSAAANGQIQDAGYPLASVVVALALGSVGISASGTRQRLLIRRLVVDVATFAGIVGLLGVVFHVSRFAALQAEGWRASANIGYANVIALLLLIGLLCACAGAAGSGALSDLIGCWVIALGLLATQSRGVLLALAVCFVVFLLVRRDVAWILAKTTAWALVAFVGLIPSIQNQGPNPLIAAVGAVVSMTLLAGTARDRSSVVRRALSVGLGLAAAVAAVARLNARIADGGSDEGRLRLWHDAIDNLQISGLFGAGPKQLGTFSSGRITQLFDHNDPLQYAQYYGVLGVAALLIVAWQLAMAFARTYRRTDGLEWSLQGAGSGYFLHVTTAGQPTRGCISVDQLVLIAILKWLRPSAHPRILIGAA